MFSPKKYFTIKVRILLTFSLLCTLAMYNFSDWVSNSARQYYLEAAEELMIDQLIFLKEHVLHHTEENAQIPSSQKLAEIFKATKKNHPQANIYGIYKSSADTYTYLTDSNGGVIFHSQTFAHVGRDFSPWRNIHLALQGQYGARSTRSDKDDPSTSVMHVSHPIFKNDRLIGTITLVKPVKRLSTFLKQARRKVLRKTILTLFLILSLGYLLMKRIVDPIERLTNYVDKLSHNEDEKLPKLPQGELQILGKTISDMRQELIGKGYIESYIEGLTHELKSPIAAIQGASELLDVKETEDNQKLLNNIKKESQRMEEMVEQLLTLSRLENSSNLEHFKEFNLSHLLKEIYADFTERHPQRKLCLNNLENADYFGDPLLITTAIHNLLNNALEFSERYSEVQLSLEGTNDQYTISVTDLGVGIPEYARLQVFDKFYSLPRPDSGRKSSGLGLSITQEIAKMHQGNVTLKSQEKGTIAELRLLRL